jgi:hypothetical protein
MKPKPLSVEIRLEREDNIPAFGGFLRCENQHEGSHVIVINVSACMSPVATTDASEVPMSRAERKWLLITTLMHEFGHALESHFRLPVNEEAIEKACENWESAYDQEIKATAPKPAAP